MKVTVCEHIAFLSKMLQWLFSLLSASLKNVDRDGKRTAISSDICMPMELEISHTAINSLCNVLFYFNQ